MRVVLLSTYDLGRQPFGLASPAAWLRERGHKVLCADLATQDFPLSALQDAELIAIHLPMHTATRLAAKVFQGARKANPTATLCAYGLYAPLNADFLKSLGVSAILGGEFEQALADLADGHLPESPVVLDRLDFRVPDRRNLPVLQRYAKLKTQEGSKLVAYTEASRGCKHLCRHCPVVNVYHGKFRVVPAEVVLADIRQQVTAGATHVTFGDPDFLNGPTHAKRLVEALHAEFPALTYDATIKIEHLLHHRDLLPVLRETGCILITTAVESLDDAVLAKLEKGHTRADFLAASDLLLREGLAMSPTFIPFTPWTTGESYHDLLQTIAALNLIENVSPVQLALRLLIPAGSRLLELPEVQSLIERYDESALLWRWRHPDPLMDALAVKILRLVDRAQKKRMARREIFHLIAQAAEIHLPDQDLAIPARATVPYLEEPWYC